MLTRPRKGKRESVADALRSLEAETVRIIAATRESMGK